MLKNFIAISLYACVIGLSPGISSALASSSKLDALFDSLKNAPDETTAREVESKIWISWLTSESSEIDHLMQQAVDKRKSYDFNGALTLLNQVIAIVPGYSEAWNQRATVYFHQSEHEKSLEDIARTLELEPRHFGALAGRAVIRLQQGKFALGLQNVLEAMKYHPYLKERAFFPSLTSETR